MVAIAYVPRITLWYAGLLSNGEIMVTVTSAPLKIPADPAPERARPTMKAIELGATADTREPTSKMKRATRKVTFVERTA